MAAKGGGSWKVAYADFVTAMMAFFLVMWIGSQDQKTRQSVANYFIDPSGSAKKPVKTGAVLDSLTYGTLPKEESVTMGAGRKSFTDPGEPSPATRLVGDWLHTDDARHKRWRDQADLCREAAARSPEVRAGTASLHDMAARELSKQLRTEFTAGMPPQPASVYQDLVYESLRDVNWTELAEDLLAK